MRASIPQPSDGSAHLSEPMPPGSALEALRTPSTTPMALEYPESGDQVPVPRDATASRRRASSRAPRMTVSMARK